MYLSRLSIADFRNYQQLDLELGPGLFLFYGDNAQGKTNLLEAVSMLATGTSFHASGDREVVNWSTPEHIAHINGLVQRREDTLQLEIVVVDPNPPALHDPYRAEVTQRSLELPAHMQRKRFKVNGAPRRTIDFIGQMKAVLFAPTDLHLVDGGPDERRRFLDRALCQVQPSYCQALMKYRKIVTQRAALLKRIRDNQEEPGMLNYLDEQLILLATQIIYERQRMVKALNELANVYHQSISGGREELRIVYRPSFKSDPASSLAEAPQHYHEQLQAARRKEILQGVCLLGPHRDDLEFLVNEVPIHIYGSRGQQRTAALSAKLAELAFMQNHTGDQPVLLLDDVFSELDHIRREYLLDQVSHYEQVMLTSTDLDSFPAEIIQRAHSFQVVQGHITPDTDL
ncbi:DNA replication and repair protein RecF [Ktedonobacteria bacterium brp13]|nr:DNA replication and repair protein RecF [Ktedonobacteria bacterium brp13]